MFVIAYFYQKYLVPKYAFCQATVCPSFQQNKIRAPQVALSAEETLWSVLLSPPSVDEMQQSALLRLLSRKEKFLTNTWADLHAKNISEKAGGPCASKWLNSK